MQQNSEKNEFFYHHYFRMQLTKIFPMCIFKSEIFHHFSQLSYLHYKVVLGWLTKPHIKQHLTIDIVFRKYLFFENEHQKWRNLEILWGSEGGENAFFFKKSVQL